MRTARRTLVVPLLLASSLSTARGDETPLRTRAGAALKASVGYFADKVASHGGFVYHYSTDLKRRWGEGEATADQIWVQPPGTPTVGLAFLDAHDATGDPQCLDAAVKAAEALVYGRLASGGWTNCVDFDPKGARTAKYRNGKGRGADNSTLDDGATQSALRFLMRTDRALGFRPGPIRDAARSGLDALLAAQFPNGGFPQVWTRPVSPRPVVPARYPEHDWRTEGKVKNYWDMYTLNDGLAGTVADALIEADEVYGDPRARAALAKLGDFLILAQMPEPQPIWAQQYDEAMRPIWARRFEPAAVTGGESQDVLETLLKIAARTGNPKYLEPFPLALAHLKGSILPDGRLARYYELRTNKPLYMTRTGDVYRLTHDDSNLPAHYGWKVPSRLAAIEKAYLAAKSGDRPSKPPPSAAELEPRVREIVGALDGEGRRVSTYAGERLVGQPKFEPGFRYVSSEVFARDVAVLCDYLRATKP